MYDFATAMLILTHVCSVFCAAFGLLQVWQKTNGALKYIEKGHLVVTGTLLLASAILLKALYCQDYSLEYVASYTDNALPMFYRLTAFWAGQPGSMLFWALSVAAAGSIFVLLKRYKDIPTGTKLWFWIFFYIIMAFFALILICWSNPFVVSAFTPADGRGLNPLLQNPGMIIHPPLLFLGYGGSTIPACLALAYAVSEENQTPWHVTARPLLLTGWSFLTAGILLGAWWAYMELGWGGYWAWDPVENASLIPWLFMTATFHTTVIEKRSHKLRRVNVLLIALTAISGFFATYLVRSGVIDSVHAFGEGSVGIPLLTFVCVLLVISLYIAILSRKGEGALASPVSREGLLVFGAWLLIAIGFIILTATMWPVISKLWSASPRGLDASFYNRVCLPLAVGILFLLAAAPLLGWAKKMAGQKAFLATVAAAAFAGVTMFLNGYRQPLPLFAVIFAAGIAGAMLSTLFRIDRAEFRPATALCHLGLALCAIGIALSGPYKSEADIPLIRESPFEFEGYTLTLNGLTEGRGPGFDYLRADIRVTKQGKEIGVLHPEKRSFDKFQGMMFTEVDVLPSLGKEIYSSLSGTTRAGAAIAKISIEPLVNWLWIGGALMTIAPLLMLGRRRKKTSSSDSEDTRP